MQEETTVITTPASAHGSHPGPLAELAAPHGTRPGPRRRRGPGRPGIAASGLPPSRGLLECGPHDTHIPIWIAVLAPQATNNTRSSPGREAPRLHPAWDTPPLRGPGLAAHSHRFPAHSAQRHVLAMRSFGALAYRVQSLLLELFAW